MGKGWIQGRSRVPVITWTPARCRPVHGVVVATLVWLHSSAVADTQTVTAPVGNPTQAVSVTARLDFTVNIGKFLFFRVGTGAFPTPSMFVDTVAFSYAPATIPAVAVVPINANNTAVNWSGGAPGFATPGTTVLPVEVRSNAGPVTIRATATSGLVSGVNSIALSRVSIASSDANLPAPTIPNAGTGPAVNVIGTAFSNLVTVRSANWTFSFNPVPAPLAGAYTGQVTFTASAP